MQLDLAGKRALVTGGTSGIGRAIAAQLISSGCAVTCTGVDQASVDRLAESEAQAVRLDVTNDDQVGELVSAQESLDILVNCAGTILREGREFDLAGFKRVLDVNLTGTMTMCSAFRPQLAKSNGCVVNLASMLSFFGSGYVPGYSASKGGVVQLTKSLAIAWAKDGIRVNAVAPGWIETEMTRDLIQNSDRSHEIVRRTPLGRWGQPDDVSGAVAFLCSDAARFITGIVLPVDGGYSVA